MASWLVVAIMVIASGTVAWWAVEPAPVEVVGHEVLTPVVRRGDLAEVAYTTLKHRSCSGEAQSVFRDSNGRITFWEPSRTGSFPRGETRAVHRFEVPYDASIGPAQYWRVLTYRCNPLFTQVVNLPVVELDIVP